MKHYTLSIVLLISLLLSSLLLNIILQVMASQTVTNQTPIDEKAQSMQSSKMGWSWEIQHYHPKTSLPADQIINYVWKEISNIPEPDPGLKQPLTEEANAYHIWKHRQQWNEWANRVSRGLELMQVNPSVEYIPTLKKIIEEDIFPKGVSPSAYAVLHSVRCAAVYTLGILGGERQYLDKLIESGDYYVYAGAVGAITYQLSMLPDVKPLQKFHEYIQVKQKGYEDPFVQYIIQKDLQHTLGVKEELQQTKSFKKKILLLIDRIYLDDSSSRTPIISENSISHNYAVFEFYRLYQQDRPRVIQIVQEHLKNQTELSLRIDLLGKLYLLGIPLTQKDLVELRKRWNIPEEWKPLTLPGVPVYDPTEFKRK